MKTLFKLGLYWLISLKCKSHESKTYLLHTMMNSECLYCAWPRSHTVKHMQSLAATRGSKDVLRMPHHPTSPLSTMFSYTLPDHFPKGKNCLFYIISLYIHQNEVSLS